MSTIIISGPGQFAPAIEKRLREDTALVRASALDACLGGVRDVVKATNDANLVDLGAYKLAWSAAPLPTGAELGNSAPYAPVIEYGRRPGRAGPPIMPIYEWVQRKFRGAVVAEFRAAKALATAALVASARRGGSTMTTAAARRFVTQQFGRERYRKPEIGPRRQSMVDARLWHIAQVIRQRIHDKGTRPHRILFGQLPALRRRFTAAVKRQLRRRS